MEGSLPSGDRSEINVGTTPKAVREGGLVLCAATKYMLTSDAKRWA